MNGFTQGSWRIMKGAVWGWFKRVSVISFETWQLSCIKERVLLDLKRMLG